MKRERGMTDIALLPLEASDRNQFILDNQEAFNYGALVEFGLQDDHFEEPDEIISRETIEKSIDGGEAYPPQKHFSFRSFLHRSMLPQR